MEEVKPVAKVIEMPRQQKRAQQREMENLQKKLHKEYFSPVPKGEFQQMFNSLSSSFTRSTISVAALIKACIGKGVFTQEEFQVFYKFEEDKQKAFQEIQGSKAPYKELFDKCKQWDIPIWVTNAAHRLRDDKTVAVEDKKALSDEFEIPPEFLGLPAIPKEGEKTDPKEPLKEGEKIETV